MTEGFVSPPFENGQKTQFKRGGAPGPGRPRGRRNTSSMMLEALVAGEAEAIAQRVVNSAKAGDLAAAKMVLDRLWPVPKGRRLELALPAVTEPNGVTGALAELLRAVAAGELSPDEAGHVADLVERQRRALELVDLDRRLAALEQRQ